MTKKDNKDKVVKQLVINKYADDSFSFDFSHKKYFDDSDLLYIAKLFNHYVDVSLRHGDKHESRLKR